MTTYQGHCADGSGIQKHSASDIYPHVITAKGEITWGIINGYTGETIWGFTSAEAAAKAGADFIAQRKNPVPEFVTVPGPTVVIDGCEVALTPAEYARLTTEARRIGPEPERAEGVGAYVRWLLRFCGHYDNETLARMVRERIPGSATAAQNIAWYRWEASRKAAFHA